MLERLCNDAGFSPNFAYAVDDVTVARGLVAAGLTVAVLPDMTIFHPRPDVAVKPLRDLTAFRTIDVMWVQNRRAPGIEQMVAALSVAARQRLGDP